MARPVQPDCARARRRAAATITDLIERKYGSRNWVVARRTSRIVERYGEDVVALSQRKFSALKAELDVLGRETILKSQVKGK